MSDEFNGYGTIRYLKGNRPGINPGNINPVLLSFLGAIACVNQIIITKDQKL